MGRCWGSKEPMFSRVDRGLFHASGQSEPLLLRTGGRSEGWPRLPVPAVSSLLLRRAGGRSERSPRLAAPAVCSESPCAGERAQPAAVARGAVPTTSSRARRPSGMFLLPRKTKPDLDPLFCLPRKTNSDLDPYRSLFFLPFYLPYRSLFFFILPPLSKSFY